MSKRSKETITLGSGDLYITEYEGKIPSNAEIETEENSAGYIQGGASLEYKPEFYTAEDDQGKVKKTIITKEEAKLKSGIMTWNAETLKKLSSTGRIKEENGMRIIKIGGIGNNNNKNYIIHFVHKDAIDGNVRVTVVGKNTAGFTLAFTKDKETVIDAEFEAVPSDNEGTLIIYQEEIENTTNKDTENTEEEA